MTYMSPRLVQVDEELFPQDKQAYTCPHQRVLKISEQAGSHRQDGSILTLQRTMTPQALESGITPLLAARVKHLNLWLNPDEDTLPKWLDVIAKKFVNLEHLTLSEERFLEDGETFCSARMRRLFVLYRLPDLKSIDEMPVTMVERNLAKPEASLSATETILQGKDVSSPTEPPAPIQEQKETQAAEEVSAASRSIEMDFASSAQIIRTVFSEDFSTAEARETSLLDSESEFFTVQHRQEEEEDQHETPLFGLAQTTIVPATLRAGEENAVEVGLGAADSTEGTLKALLSLDEDEEDQDNECFDLAETTPIMRMRGKPVPPRSQKGVDPVAPQVSSMGTESSPEEILSSSLQPVEMVSVVSSNHEWTGACGGYLPFCGAPCGLSRKQKVEDSKRQLKLNRERKLSDPQLVAAATTPRQSQSTSSSSEQNFSKFKTKITVDSHDTPVAEKQRKQKNQETFPSNSLSAPTADSVSHFKTKITIDSQAPPERSILPVRKSLPGLSPRNGNILLQYKPEKSTRTKKVSSRSLSSPFPMQFREQAAPSSIPSSSSSLLIPNGKSDEENHQPTPSDLSEIGESTVVTIGD